MTGSYKKTVARLKRHKDKSKATSWLYLTKDSLKEFKRICKVDGVSASKVIDEWIKQAIVESKGKKGHY